MKESIWQKDITHHMLGTLAVFGLVVSASITTLGVAALGVDTQVAFAQNDALVSQTAAVMEIAKHPDPAILMKMASTTEHNASSTAATFRAAMASSSAMYCPQIARSVGRGGHDATTTGDITELQRFIASRYGLNQDDVVTGFFGSTTQAFVERFQKEQGIPPAPAVGPLTRAAIARLCGGITQHALMGPGDMRPASTSMMGSSTPPMHPRDVPPPASTTNSGVSIQNYEGVSNAAAVVNAVGEISDGYNKLLGATLSLIGL